MKLKLYMYLYVYGYEHGFGYLFISGASNLQLTSSCFLFASASLFRSIGSIESIIICCN